MRATFRERKAERTDYYYRFEFGWKQRPCAACNGSGYYDQNGSPRCGSCDGTGKETFRGPKGAPSTEIDMARRCEHCKHWVDTVFKGQSASGWGVWYGNCHNPEVPMTPIGKDRHSLMLACKNFESGEHPNSLNAMTANA